MNTLESEGTDNEPVFSGLEQGTWDVLLSPSFNQRKECEGHMPQKQGNGLDHIVQRSSGDNP